MRSYRSLVHLSVFGAWAVSFGCAVGWDVLVLPWTTFLPEAGSLGSLLGIFAGALVMCVIAWNFHYMIRKCPGPGGVYAYAKRAFGPDHGYICAWFLCLAYAAIVWADSAALAAVVRYMVGEAGLRQAFTLRLAGLEVYFGDMLTVAAAMGVVVALCLRRRMAAAVQVAFALMLVLGLAVCFGAAVRGHTGGTASLMPLFASGRGAPFSQFLNVLAIAPWLFVGFEAMSGMSAEFGFPRRKSFGIMVAAIAASMAAYVAAMLIPVFAAGDGGWSAAVAASAGDMNAHAYDVVRGCLGAAGPAVLAVTLAGALFTNLVGNTIVAGRIVAAMADDGAMPLWLGRWRGELSARRGIAVIAGLAVSVSALGEEVLNVVVDIALVGVSVSYIYTSAATFRLARRAGDRLSAATGLFGVVSSAVIALLFLLPALSSSSFTMGTGSFLVLIGWCIAGIVSFLFIFRRDGLHRFGHSPAVWTALFVMVVVLTHLWVRQSARETMLKAYDDIAEYHSTACLSSEGAAHEPPAQVDDWHAALRDRLKIVRRVIVRNSYVRSALDLLALLLMFAIYRVLRNRERDMEQEKAKAKSYFFSTVSHDIRTPLNAIIGYSEMLKAGFRTEAEREQALGAILVSSRTLLGLVNDILDLSKLESGKMEICPEPTDCARLVHEVADAFRAANGSVAVEVRCRANGLPPLLVDPQRLRQIAFNLAGNAMKFTESGFVEIHAAFMRASGAKTGTFRLSVEDTGCGIGEEDLARLGSAYVQVGAKTGRNGGTGLGLAICRQLAAAMGGRLDVESTLGVGSTFTLVIPNVKVAESNEVGGGGVGGGGVGSPTPNPTPTRSPANLRILVVDDAKMNRMVLKALLEHLGQTDVAFAADGEEALACLRAPGERPFDLVLTDMWMPRLDGAALVKALRADPALAGLRVIVVTADVEFRAKFAKLGFDGILLKPITTEKLAQTLEGGEA